VVRGSAKAKTVEAGRRVAKPKIAEEARRAAEAKAAKVVRGSAKTKAVEAGRRVAKPKTPKEASSGAATHPGRRPEEMAVPPADLRLIKGIVAKPTRAASQKRTAPRMRAK
jgi:fused signal recognition particle receptor